MPTDFVLEITEKAFNAYNKQAGGKTWDGKDIPPFSEVGDKVRANWVAAIEEVLGATNYYEAQEELLFLGKLRAAGVNNWEGYEEAQNM